MVAIGRFPAQQEARAVTGKRFEALAAEIPGVRVMPHDERITRWSFYNYILAIDPERFGGATNEVVCAAMEAEGIPAEVQYPSMNRYELFQPALSRLPVAVEHADRLDMATMSFPVAEAAGQRESVYFMENVFRDGDTGHPGRRRGPREDPAQRRRTPPPRRWLRSLSSALRFAEEPREVVAVLLEQVVEHRLGHVVVPTSGLVMSAFSAVRLGLP